jgi:hypothetical protein
MARRYDEEHDRHFVDEEEFVEDEEIVEETEEGTIEEEDEDPEPEYEDYGDPYYVDED